MSRPLSHNGSVKEAGEFGPRQQLWWCSRSLNKNP